MNKTRVEALSDGVFAIVMTLLVMDIKVPEGDAGALDSLALLHELTRIGPTFGAYFVSFAVLAMFWMSHHGIFHHIGEAVDRVGALINMLYLCLLSLIPFSAHLLGRYPHTHTGAAFYGANVLAIAITGGALFTYQARTDFARRKVDPKLLRQARIRVWLPAIFALLGIAASWVSAPLAFALFAFPVVFNVIPGTLALVERIFGVEV